MDKSNIKNIVMICLYSFLVAFTIIIWGMAIDKHYESKNNEMQEQFILLETKLNRLITQTEILEGIFDNLIYCIESIENDLSIEEYVYTKSLEYGIDPEIVYSLLNVETGFQWFDPIMDSNGYYSVGYAMINGICEDYLLSNGIDYTTETGNIDACLFILSPMVEKYGLYDGLRAYNAGEQGMLNGGGHYYATKVLGGME